MTAPRAAASGPAAPRPARRRRSATESLLSVVLGLEALLVFFIALVLYGLETVPSAVAFGGGALLVVLFLVAARGLAAPWGTALGWVLQGVLIALGLVLIPLYFVGAGFAAMWVYCFVVGRRLDRRNAAYLAGTTEPDPA